MVRPLSMDLRARAVARIAAGESVRKVALAVSVAPSSVVIGHAHDTEDATFVSHTPVS